MKTMTIIMLLAFLIGALWIPVNTFSENTTRQGSYYLKYSLDLTMSGTSQTSGPFNMKITGIFTLTINITNQTVTMVSELVNLTATSTINGTTTTFNLGQFLGAGKKTVETYSISDFYSKAFNDVSSQYQQAIGSQMGSIGYTYSIKYEGLDTYQGYPVHKYRMEYSYSGSHTTMNATGEIYVYVGLFLPLYMKVHADMASTGSSATMSMTLKATEASLPTTSVQAVVETGKATIIAGGLPGAKITVKGSKGSSTLTVTNKGTQPGYIAVITKTGLKTAYIPVMQGGGNYRVVGVAPGETKQIDLGFTLDKDVSATTQEVTGGPNWIIISIILGIVAAVIGGVIWLIHHVKSKAKKTAAETLAERGEQPPPPPPPPETPGGTPSPEGGEGGTQI